MVGAFISVSVSPVSGFSQPSRRMLTTDWLMDRLPAEAIAMMRWPGRIKTWSLRKVAMLSTPALVRVSANMTRPSRTRMPQQYVMTFDALPCQPALYTDLGDKPAMLRQARHVLAVVVAGGSTAASGSRWSRASRSGSWSDARCGYA